MHRGLERAKWMSAELTQPCSTARSAATCCGAPGALPSPCTPPGRHRRQVATLSEIAFPLGRPQVTRRGDSADNTLASVDRSPLPGNARHVHLSPALHARRHHPYPSVTSPRALSPAPQNALFWGLSVRRQHAIQTNSIAAKAVRASSPSINEKLPTSRGGATAAGWSSVGCCS